MKEYQQQSKRFNIKKKKKKKKYKKYIGQGWPKIDFWYQATKIKEDTCNLFFEATNSIWTKTKKELGSKHRTVWERRY